MRTVPANQPPQAAIAEGGSIQPAPLVGPTPRLQIGIVEGTANGITDIIR
jgi:hypothetical protein